MIIGIAGYARSGKDTVASILTEKYGYQKRAFADPIRDAVYALNPYVKNSLRVQDLVDEFGWETFKGFDEGRRLIQVMGTEIGREMFDNDIWIKKTLDDLNPYDRWVISDVRFADEARAIVKRGGVIWRVEREGVGPVNDHKSDNGMVGWRYDTILRNNFSLEELEAMVISTMDWYDVHRNTPTLPA